MKYSFIIICLINVCALYSQSNGIESQVDNKPIGKIIYIFNSSLLKDGDQIERQASLIFNETSSLFVHSKTDGNEIILFINGVDCINGCYRIDQIGNTIYKNHSEKIIVNREMVQRETYVATENLPNFNWAITNEKKMIGSFECQMAKVNFRGRNFTAWFASTIPISEGPWKFHGLPGLILEVYSDDGEYSFLFKSIEIPFEGNDAIKSEILDTDLKVDFKTFVKADEIEFNKAKKKSEAQWLSSGGEPGGFKMTRTLPSPIELNYDDMEK